MTVADDRREELEALLWQNAIPAPVVAEILAAADGYARASRPPRVPAEPGKPPAVHYALEGRGRPACRPHDLLAGLNWAVSGDPQTVTCGHCRKIAGAQEAGAA